MGCEKPIALTAADAKKMVKAAADSGKQLIIGHVLPFFSEFAYAHKIGTLMQQDETIARDLARHDDASGDDDGA